MAAPTRLGDLLLHAGVITQLQLETALTEQKKWGGKLGAILVRMGALSEDLLIKALSRQLGIPRANLEAVSVPEAIKQRLDKTTCEQLSVCPVRYVQERRALMVAVSDPFNVVILDDLGRRVGLRIEPLLAGETQIVAAIGRLFGTHIDESITGQEPGMKLTNNAGNTLLEQAPIQDARPPTRMDAPAPAPVPIPTPAPRRADTATTGGGDPAIVAIQQAKAVQALCELLVEKRVLTREEVAAFIARARG